MSVSREELLNKLLKEKGMNFLFLHRNFPAQFRHILIELSKNPLNLLIFITNNDGLNLPGVNKLFYPVEKRPDGSCHNYLSTYEEAVLHGQGAANMAMSLKKRGIKPDIVYGHSWGPPMFMKDIFPDVPLLCYFEWFNNAEGADLGFDGTILTTDQMAHARCNNSVLLLDLESCDAGITPTHWQKSQFPKEFHHKIKVLHDGVNTDWCHPDKNAKFVFQKGEKTFEFSAEDEVITYTTRGMEPYRGFPEFMKAISILQKKRPNAHFVIAGEDVVCYGSSNQGSYKEKLLKEYEYDMERTHFVGTLAHAEYIKLLQISSAHIYLTVPFILSWSVLDAMACGCCVVASSTPPVLEVIQDNYNGLLFDFYDIDGLVDRVEYAIDNKEKMKEIRKNAVQTILDNYDFKKLLPQHIEYIRSLVNK